MTRGHQVNDHLHGPEEERIIMGPPPAPRQGQAAGCRRLGLRVRT